MASPGELADTVVVLGTARSGEPENRALSRRSLSAAGWLRAELGLFRAPQRREPGHSRQE
jgi:hypothetical protein